MGVRPRRWVPILATPGASMLVGMSLPAPVAMQSTEGQPPIDERETPCDADGLIIHHDGGGEAAQREGPCCQRETRAPRLVAPVGQTR
jgi:hypothetical protein